MNPNEALTIRVQGKDGFKGFLIQVRQESTDQPIGTFIQDDNKKKTFNCVSDNVSLKKKTIKVVLLGETLFFHIPLRQTLLIEI